MSDVHECVCIFFLSFSMDFVYTLPSPYDSASPTKVKILDYVINYSGNFYLVF